MASSNELCHITFTYELEEANKILFLDVLVIRKDNGNMETSVYRKATLTDVYLNCNAHAPNVREISTIRSLVKRAFTISSNNISLNFELNHLESVFTRYNNYPSKIITNIIKRKKTKNWDRQSTNHRHIFNNHQPVTLPTKEKKLSIKWRNTLTQLFWEKTYIRTHTG